jgi:hypothetical protein
MTDSRSSSAKVLFRIQDEDGSTSVETLWATDLGNDHYKLDNSPFHAYSVSWEDVVYAPFDEDQGFPAFRSVATKSGNRTIRLILDPPFAPGNPSDLMLQKLLAFGCCYEGANKTYIAVNIPADVDLQVIRDYLVETGATWEHADPTYAELFPERD